MKLAYFIALHKDPAQFRWLFDAIYDARDIFVIHVDVKSPDAVMQGVRDIVGDRPNVHFAPRMSVVWGGWSMCQVELDTIRHLLAADDEWDYLINLSGQDYPLKTRAEIVADLEGVAPASYVQMKPMREMPWNFRQRSRWLCLEINEKMVRLPVPLPPSGKVKVDWFGAMWHVLHRDLCRWVAEDSLAGKIAARLKYMKIPDEILLQTMAAASGLPVVSSHRREIVWKKGSPHPETLTADHLPRLEASDAFFARKFDRHTDEAVLEALAARLGAGPEGDSAPPMAISATSQAL